jgi:sulfate transporter 4
MACRNIRQYPEAAEESGLLLVRLDAPLYFANVQYVRDRLRKYELRSQVSSHGGGG